MSRYRIFVTRPAFKQLKTLPGNMRQRVRRAIRDLAENPRPTMSKALDAPDLDREIRRLRLERWRIVYTIVEADNTVDVLAIRKRPPYDYGDLRSLLEDVD